MKTLTNIYVVWIVMGGIVMLLGIYMLATADMMRGIALIAIGGICEGVGVSKYLRRKS